MSPQVLRRPIVGVMGSGSDEHRELADPIGVGLAQRGVHLLNGGGSGVMCAVSRAFVSVKERGGLVVGVLPSPSTDDPTLRPAGYPNPFVELAIRTHLPFSGERGDDPLSRNHINVLSSDVLVVLPGRAGTRSELALAHRYGVRTVVVASPDWRDVSPSATFVDDAEHALDVVDRWLEPAS